ncbi:MAG: hypothetical protein HY674_20320, partial [Chloroflexi bacterium]|nr:hypothetical protein [Chloroflexota bacterium]
MNFPCRLDIVGFWVPALLVAGALFFGLVGVSAQTTAVNNAVAGKSAARSSRPLRIQPAGGLRPETRGRPRFFPVVAQPTRKLIAVDVFNAPSDERLLLLSLQGMVNRKQPRIYLIPDSKWIGDGKHEPPAHRRDEFWLDWLIEKGFVKEAERLQGDSAGIANLLKRFRSFYRGAVIPDPDLPVGKNMAITIAGVEDLLVCTPALAAQYGLPVKMDLCGRFPSNHEAMEWVWRTYRDRLNPHLLASANPRANRGLAWAFSGDYYVQNRAFVFWVTGKEGVGKPFCNAEKEKAVVESILAELPPNIPVCGFTWAGNGEGLGEDSGLKMISEWGDVLVPVGIPNLSVHSGFRLPGLKQGPKRAAPNPDISYGGCSAGRSSAGSRKITPRVMDRAAPGTPQAI